MMGHHYWPACIRLLPILSLGLLSCDRFDRGSVSGCCVNLSVEKVLEAPPNSEGVEDGEAIVFPKFDHKSVVVTIADRQHRIRYFYSEDAGATWHHDVLYQELSDLLTRRVRAVDPLPWYPSPAYPRVRYRTAYSPEGAG